MSGFTVWRVPIDAMTDSFQLLQDYLKTGSERAFAAIVERHAGLVYSVALRLVGGDSHLAEDVAQNVFADLARKARTLPSKTVLSGWLHRHTCFTACKAVRQEQRRKNRELRAQDMQTANYPTETGNDEILKLLDESIEQLRGLDRTVLALRFFENQNLRDIGETLGLSEEAVRKRVSRSVDQLRSILQRKGVTVGSAAILAALANQSALAAPFGLVASLTANSLIAAASTSTFGLSAINLMSLSKIKTAMIATAIVATVTPIVIQRHQLREAQQRMTILANENDLLMRENAALDEVLKRSPQPGQAVDQAELNRLRAAQSELLKLRAEAARARQENDRLQSTAARAQELADREKRKRLAVEGTALANGNVEIMDHQERKPLAEVLKFSNLQNAGTDSPTNILQTYFWAVLNDHPEISFALAFDRADQSPTPDDISHIREGFASWKRQIEGVVGIKLLSEGRFKDDVGNVVFEFDYGNSPRPPGAPTGGDITLRKIGDVWKIKGFGTRI